MKEIIRVSTQSEERVEQAPAGKLESFLWLTEILSTLLIAGSFLLLTAACLSTL